jgi:hypothetical protein
MHLHLHLHLPLTLPLSRSCSWTSTVCLRYPARMPTRPALDPLPLRLERQAKLTPDRTAASLMREAATALSSQVGPGRPSTRLEHLLDGLALRFPLAHSPVRSDPPEPCYLAAIDELLASDRKKEIGS